MLHHFVVNPSAGAGRAASALPTLRLALERSGLTHQIHLTERPGHAQEIVQALPESEPVIAVGGDGTQHEIVAALLQNTNSNPRALGLVPLGTGDDFARGFGLPRQLEAALGVIVAGNTGWIDAGRLNGRPFVNGVGSGFDAQVARTVKSAPAGLPGPMRYLWAILAELSKLEPRPARVLMDGLLVHSGPALLVAVMNLRGYGGGLRIAPEANASDGLLDVVIGGRFSKWGAVGILPRLAAGSHLGHPEVQVHVAKQVRIEWQDLMAAHIDGELLEPSQIFQAEVLPQALRVFTP